MALPSERDDKVVELVRERQAGDNGELIGVGITFQRRADGEIYIAAVNPGSVAEKSRKFGRGQLVYAVNGWSVHGLSEDRVWEMVLGPERSRLQIAVGEKPENADEMFTFHPAHVNAQESRMRFRESLETTSIPGFVGISFDSGISGLHRIVGIVPGGPASGNGMLRVGDILSSIDGIPVSNKSNDEVKQMIAGPAGAWITLEVQRPGAASSKLAVQRVAKLPSADSKPAADKDTPDPNGVPRPAMVGASAPTPGRQHGAFLDDKIMKAVQPEVKQGEMIASGGQKQLLMEFREGQKGVFSKEVAANAPELLKMPAGTVQVSIYYAKHLPVKTMFGLTDTYVRATYEGKTMRTRTVRLSLDPKYNTTMRFPSGDCVNAVSIEVYQVGGIGSDLEIGQLIIPYKDIARGVNKEFALFERSGASVVGLQGKTTVLYVRGTADMREQDIGEIAHRRAEREWAAQAMALATEAKKWPDWMPSDHAHKYGEDPHALGPNGETEAQRSLGLTILMEEDYADAKKHERAFSQHLVNDLAVATDSKPERFQYVGIDKGSVLATVNVLPSKDPKDTRTAMNVVSEITIQTYDASSKLRRLPCTYTARNAHSHPPRKPPTRATWGLKNWLDGFGKSSPNPPEGPDEGSYIIPEDELGGEHKPVFGATAMLPVLNRVSEVPPQPVPSQQPAQQQPHDSQSQPPAQPQQSQQPVSLQKPVGFFASATVLDKFMGSPSKPDPTVISNKHAVAGAETEPQTAQQQHDPANVSALFNSLMTSFAGRNPFDAARLQQSGSPSEVKVLVKQGRHILHSRFRRAKVYFCVSLLAVGSRLDNNVTHKTDKGAHMESLDPETLDRSDQSPLNKYELVAQYRGHLVGLNSDLATYEWEESVKLRECISAVGKKNPTEPQKEPLKGQPVQMLITLHGNDVAMGDETLGWTLVPITPDTEVNHWFPLMDTSGAIKNVNRQQSCIHLSYSYAAIGQRGHAEDDESGEVEDKPNSRIDRSLIPTDVVHGEKAPAPDSVVGRPASERPASELTSVPPTGNYEFHAVKNAVRGVKALVANGYEVVLVGCGDVNVSRKAMTALKRVGLVADDKSPVKLNNVIFVDTQSEKAEVAKQLGGFVGVVDRDWDALSAVVEELEDGTQCILFNPTREGRRKFLEAVMKREADEAELALLTVQLARLRSKLRSTELGLARVGVDMRAQSRYTPKEEDPQVKKMIENYISEELKVSEIAQRVKELMAKTVSPLISVPTTRNELGLVQKKKPDGWEETCHSLGLDANLLQVYDERPAFSQMVKPSPADPPPFYPLALTDSSQAMLRMPHRIEAWEIAKRKGVHPASETCGVGISVSPGRRGELLVSAVEYGGSAFVSRAVSVGDKLVSVDGEVLLGMDERDVKRMLYGKRGTVVLLELVKEDEQEPQTVVLERKETVPLFRENKGRVMVALNDVVLFPQVDNDLQKGGLVRITVGTATHLPRAVNVEAIFCLIKISQPTSVGQPTVLRSDLVPVSPPPFASALFDAKFESQVEDLAKQIVTLELYWPDPHRRSGVLVGSSQLTCEQMVAGKGFRWVTVLDLDGKPVKGTDSEDCKLQLAGEIVVEDKAEKLIEEAKASQAKSEALAAQDTVGVSLVLDEDFNEKVGYDKDKRLNFANELRLDLAAALYTSEDRFVVCGLQPGSVVAHVNIIQDYSGADPREPKALAKLLTNQVVDKSSPLHWAQTTRKCVSITTAPAFKAPKGPKDALHIPDTKPGAARELAPRERAAGVTLQSQAERDRERLSGLAGSDIGDYGPLLGQPERELTPKERQGAALNSLAAGMMRSKEPGLFAEPAVVALTFGEESNALETAGKQAQIHSDLADILYLPVEAIDIGGYDPERRTMDVAVFPFSKRAAERIKQNMELARKMVPGVQHLIAAQLVSQVFDKTSPLWQLPSLDNIEWAQVVKQPRHEQTKLVVRRMQGEDLERDPTGAVGAASAAARNMQQAALGEGLKSTAAPSEKVWVASPTLGMAWEELVDRTGEPYWVNHKEKLVSYSHPKYHWPLPRGWTQHVDDRRRVYYSPPGKKRTQWEHPCSPSVVYGVVIQGYSEAAVQLRDWVRSNGWKDIGVKLSAESWARDFEVEEDGVRTRVLEAPPGQTKKVAAAYTFKMKWEDVPMKERGMQPLPPPAIGEDFVTLDANMVALMMTQYPAGYYILFRPSLQRVKAAEGFTTVWVTCRSTSGEVIHRKVTVVGRDKKGAHPGYTGRYEGWAITEVEEPWRLDPAQMLQRGLMFSSIAVLLQTHPEEFVIRVDPDQEIPSCRFVRKTWGSQDLPADLMEDQDALSRPLVHQKELQAAKDAAEQRKQFSHISPEVQGALLTMGHLPEEDAIGGIAEQEAAAFAAGLSEVDILPFEERPGYTEFTVHLRRAALRAGNSDGLSGIGLVLQALHNPDDPYMVVEVDATGPAGISQEVEVGDILMAVDSYQTKHLTLPDVIARIKGPPFAPVTLFLRRKVDNTDASKAVPGAGALFE